MSDQILLRLLDLALMGATYLGTSSMIDQRTAEAVAAMRERVKQSGLASVPDYEWQALIGDAEARAIEAIADLRAEMVRREALIAQQPA